MQKELKEEIRQLKAEEEKEFWSSAKTNETETSASYSVPTDDIFSKLLKVPSPFPDEASALHFENHQKRKLSDNKDTLQLSPIPEFAEEGDSFMVFKSNDWEGPYTLFQLRSNGHLNPNTWVCRVGSQLVIQAHEVADLHTLIH